MKQYNGIKAKYPDALLLFRVGDFYETFGEDAVKASKVLGIVLTKRKNGAAAFIDLAGFPHHSLDSYLPKLVRAGYRVAICDQLEDPKQTKKIVKRGVTELITPGVALNDNVLDNKSNNFLAALHFNQKRLGVSFLDISTGEFLISEGDEAYILKLLEAFKPSEVLHSRAKHNEFEDISKNAFNNFELEDWIFEPDFAEEKLLEQFQTLTLKGFGISEMKDGVIAAGAILQYLRDTHHTDLNHIRAISRLDENEHVWLDPFTIRNLELIHPLSSNGLSLMSVMDHTSSPMGARLLKRWILLPLKDLRSINDRLDGVSYFSSEEERIADIALMFKQIGDVERIISRVAVKKANPKEILHLASALEITQPIKEICNSSGVKALKKISDELRDCSELREKIVSTLHPEAPALFSKGNYINDGFNEELDELRSIAFSGKDHLIKLQEREIENTGIPSLKIGYNNVFGYYLEVRNTHKDKVPEEWIRKQTLTQAERYITPELKEYETKILGAQDKISIIENQLFASFMENIQVHIPEVQETSMALAKLDCLVSFAKIAIRNGYTRPQIGDDLVIDLKESRHAVIEQNLPLGEKYVPNDIYLDNDTQQVIMITGPNMSGKSAILRQTALCVLMAQMGSFIPAKSARIGLVDKIFTRVGASDNISSGESTFMVEMNETASILNNLSMRSLILLDEIGRGTSTYDGISIAWAITEYLHENGQFQPKTLFATHYHELNEMATKFERIRNHNVSVKEIDKKIVFLRKLKAGGSAHSFGIEVAKMAGIPSKIVFRAKEVLKSLEKMHDSEQKIDLGDDMQLSFFQLDDPVLQNIKEELIKTDINSLTPVEALFKLDQIKKMVGG
ncbi:MAG: DNA mismatch repair protein MutS [Flavobacteriales bacterium]|nr:DNA mismatch repair protein MutS [Flavobacteriales bacterium]